jgi:hypothetical protein
MDMKSNHSQSALLNNKCIILCCCTTLYLVCHKSEPLDPPPSHLLYYTFTFIITQLNKTKRIYNCTMADPGPSFGQINHKIYRRVLRNTFLHPFNKLNNVQRAIDLFEGWNPLKSSRAYKFNWIKQWGCSILSKQSNYFGLHFCS